MITIPRKLRRLYRSASLSHKLFLSFSLLIAVPAIAVSFLFIRSQENQLYKNAMAAGNSQVQRAEERLRSRMNMVENVSSIALSQKAFVDYIHSDMRSDGLALVRFRQNEFEQMRHVIQSNELIGQLSFYVDNPNLQEIWPEIYAYDKFQPQDYWKELKEEGGAAYRLFAFRDGDHTLSYYRIVRLQGQRQQHPTVMEIRSPHEIFFGELLQETEGEFFPVVMDRSSASRSVYNPGHAFALGAGDELDAILGRVHAKLKVLPEETSPVKVRVGEHTYYALYRYIAPLDAYAVDIASRDALLRGPRTWYVVVVAVTGLVLLLMLLLVTLTTRRVFRRLGRVLVSMRKVRQGRLDAKIDVGLEPHETGDEIDEVAVSYNKMLDEIQRLMTQVVDKQLIAKNAQLHSLHSQINSHFLYNALESIRMLAEVERQPAIASALVTLGSLMRYSMKWRSDTVTLGEELANIRSYVEFMNFMEGGKFVLTADPPPEVQRYAIPKMCLQPIVENAVRHAAPMGGPVRIRIRAEVAEERLLIVEIRDDGVGIEPGRLAELQAALQGGPDSKSPAPVPSPAPAPAPVGESRSGLGLENVHKRLQLHYGQEYGLTMDSEQGAYTLVTIRLPWENDGLGGW